MTMIDGTVERLYGDEPWAVVVRPDGPVTDAAAWTEANLAAIEALAADYPVVLLRDFGARDEDDFKRVRDRLIPQPAGYVYRSTPRTELADGVLTTTEYPAEREILLHCENAYQRDWPLRMLFGCVDAPDSGGQSPMADVRAITGAIGEEIVAEFERRGVQYVRNYHDGFDLDWRTVFQTDDPQGVEAYCAANDIQFEWLADGHLRTRQVCQGTARHPVTGDRLWFNQAHLFHPSALGAEVMEDLLDIFGEEGLPRNAYYGDGAPIEAEILDRVRDAFAACARQFDWRVGDVMLFDNMLSAHGRRPFTGSRKVLVSFGKMMSSFPL
ncbi:TauD/TfdA family dioxygenase [Endothiovibrio diazotrophicus]